MNKNELDILREKTHESLCTQRDLACDLRVSLGLVNKTLKSLVEKGYLDEDYSLSERGWAFINTCKPKRAIILAAGTGLRMIPISSTIPKGLIEIEGEIIIERLIRQLNSVGVKDIYVVVGFMKEKFEYLIDKYGVNLIINPYYATRNNLYSLALTADLICDSYILPADLWCVNNPFNSIELYSWYMVSDKMEYDGGLRVNRKGVLSTSKAKGNRLIGISYVTGKEAIELATRINYMKELNEYNNAFWEEAFFKCDSIIAKVVDDSSVIEINTYEDLRSIDRSSKQLSNTAIDTIKKVFDVSTSEIQDIQVLKKGMTNRSFLFSCKGRTYIMRIPGEGTEKLINRNREYDVYQKIKEYEFSDDIVYINAETGYKITEYIPNVRTCNPYDKSDVEKCISCLKSFHNLKINVKHSFDIFEQIAFYESLWEKQSSVYDDYFETKEKVFRLKSFIDSQPKAETLTHIDAIPDNFLFFEKDGVESIRLIDWEYAGMQDPHVDVAMFCIYSLYDKEHVDSFIELYLGNEYSELLKLKIYCYIAVCGLLWSNWCEYKQQLGVEFGEYSIRQYRYAKDYYKFAYERLKELGYIEALS